MTGMHRLDEKGKGFLVLDRLRKWNERQLAATREREAKIKERKRSRKEAVAGLEDYVKDHKDEIVTRLGSIYVFPERIVKLPHRGALVALDDPMRRLNPEEQPVAGVEARVEETGGISNRATLTRAATIGGGWQKQTDDRKMYLIVDGPEFQWQIEL